MDHVDLDGEVVEACKENFPWGAAWDDPRVTLHIADGAAFVEQAADASYDIIIQDSSDPWTEDLRGNRVILPSSVLYTRKHVADIHRILTPSGIFNFQAETFNIPSDVVGIIEWRKQALGVGFHRARYGSIYISSYPTGQIGFMLCEKEPSEAASLEQVNERYASMVKKGAVTTYYQPKLQQRYVPCLNIHYFATYFHLSFDLSLVSAIARSTYRSGWKRPFMPMSRQEPTSCNN